MTNITPRKPARARLAAAAFAAALASSTALAVAPGVASAEPAGGYANLVSKVSPSVVFIEVTEKAKQNDMSNFPFQEFSRQFGIPFPGMQGNDGDSGSQAQNAPEIHGVGSGFIIDPSGYIVTNNHVVDGASQVKVTLQDGNSYTAKVVGRDPVTDVALIKVDAPKPLPAVQFGSSKKIRVGDDVMAVGNPFGLGGTVTTGIISAKARDLGGSTYDDYLQTDAAINKGNSGGPLFDDAGQVVGMNTAIISPDGGSVGIGFAVPSDVVENVVAQLKDHGSVSHGWLGVAIRPVSPDVAAALGMDNAKGAMVVSVSPDSPAAKAGLKRGDIITKFGDTEIDKLNDLPRAVAMTAPSTKEPLDVLRAGKQVQLDINVGTLPKQSKA